MYNPTYLFQVCILVKVDDVGTVITSTERAF